MIGSGQSRAALAERGVPSRSATPGLRLSSSAGHLLLSAIATVGSLLLAEWIVRVVAPQGLATPGHESLKGLEVQRANLSGTDKVPGLFSVTYHTNSQRFRGLADYSYQPPAGVIRVITIGDSFCFGVGAEDDQTYPFALENFLSAAGKKVQVVNAGIGGTGTGSQALWYDIGIATFNPSVVVLSVFVNDIDDDFSAPMFTLDAGGNAVPIPQRVREQRVERRVTLRSRVNAIPGYALLAEHSQLVNLVRRLASVGMALRKPRPESEGEARRYQGRYLTEGIPLFKAEMKWLNRQVRGSGAKLVLAWFPPRETIYPDSGSDAEQVRWKSAVLLEALADFSAREEVPLLDPTRTFQAKASTPGELFYNGADRHARPAGYQLFAQEVGSFLLSDGATWGQH
jgi:GDSL-like lipase/acylhydrolase family protein